MPLVLDTPAGVPNWVRGGAMDACPLLAVPCPLGEPPSTAKKNGNGRRKT